MQSVKTYTVQIFVGLRVAYGEVIHPMEDVLLLCSAWVNEKKDCITVTSTEYWYVDGWEPGVIIGFINYPRFPKQEAQILERALDLAEQLRIQLGQIRVTVMTPTDTILLGDD